MEIPLPSLRLLQLSTLHDDPISHLSSENGIGSRGTFTLSKTLIENSELTFDALFIYILLVIKKKKKLS